MGYDHASKHVGFGVVDYDGTTFKHIAHGHLDYVEDWPNPMPQVHRDALWLFQQYGPDVIVFEEQSALRNAVTLRVLVEAQSMAKLAAVKMKIPFVSIRAVTVKRVVAGSGKADKKDVVRAAMLMLGLSTKLTLDEGDALGLVLSYPVWKAEQEAEGAKGDKKGRK